MPEQLGNDHLGELRKRAEARLVSEPEQLDELSPEEIRKLVHELRTQQIELEMQNAELRQSQEELANARDQYIDLYDFAPVGYVTLSDKGIIQQVNLTLTEMLGVPRAQLLHHPLSAFVVAEDADVCCRHLRDVLRAETDQPCELRLKGPNSSVFWATVECGSEQPSEAVERAFQCAIYDVTQRKEAEDRVQEGRDFAESLIATAQVIVLVLDTEGRIVRFNPYMEQLSGYRLDEVKGEDWFTTFLPDRDQQQIRELFRNAVDDMRTRGKVNAILTKDGRERQVEWYDRTLKNARGEVTGVLAIGQDITVRLQTEAHLRQQQKLESMGTLAGGVAHEINNPISGIMGYAQLIRDRLEGHDEEREFAQEIIHETDRVATIVRSLLQFARQDEAQERRVAGIVDIVDGTLALIRLVIKRDRIGLEVDLPDDLPGVSCCSRQIQQVLMNLLTNARDALNERYAEFDENKVIRVTAEAGRRTAEGGWERGTGSGGHRGAGGPPPAVPSSEWVRVTVEDHGVGISDDVRDCIFDPFVTTKRPGRGTGLGLSVSHTIVREHGGVLSVQSKPGEWTQFHLDLPAEPGEGE